MCMYSMSCNGTFKYLSLSQVWTPVPMVMICSALFLITVPLVYVSVERWYILLGLVLVLTGAPVYLLLISNKYRPAVFTRISSK